KDVCVFADDATLVDHVSLSVSSGELVAILGPNGAGKTTLLRALVGLIRPDSGWIGLDGENCTDLSNTDRAKKISYLPQRRPLAWPNKVRDVVALGRFAHGASLGRLSRDDAGAVDEALAACDLQHLADRTVDTLSGGELARTHFARAIASRAPLLIADEPVAALDPRHHLRIAQLLRDFVDAGGGALVVLHDVPMAVRFADRLVWMRDSKILAEGSPEETLTAQIMQDVYGVNARVVKDDTGFNVQIVSAL
ncbi:MAG: ABC transporter ATP-binding protein, partial [Pseudomonadota bacterium]